MSTIRFAVLVNHARANGGPQVEHLYQHRADAEMCARAYASQLGLQAGAFDLVPALAVSRLSDAWASLAAGQLRVYPTREAAQAGVPGPDARGVPLAPAVRRPARAFVVRRGMPVQSGVPQFAAPPAARPPGDG